MYRALNGNDSPRSRMRVLLLILCALTLARVAAPMVARLRNHARNSPPRPGSIAALIVQAEKEEFKRPVYKLPPPDAKAALLKMFGGEFSGMGGLPVKYSQMNSRNSEIVLISRQIQSRIKQCEKNDVPPYPVLQFEVDGWKCDGRSSTFYKTLTLEGGRKYKLRGQFVQSPKGEWSAQVTRLTRLMTRAEYSAASDRDLVLNKTVELIPTPEEARAALIQWLLNLDLGGEVPAHLAHWRDGVARVLGSRQEGKELREEYVGVYRDPRDPYPDRGPSRAQPYVEYITIGKWYILVEDLVFKRVIPISGLELAEVDGHFELTSGGKWKAVGAHLHRGYQRRG